MARQTTFLFGLLLLGSLPVGHAAQQPAPAYPEKPVHIIVGFPAGAGPDILARLLAERLSTSWNRAPVIVENKPGAGGIIAASYAARAVPDGYTLLLGVTGNMIIAPASHDNLTYDPFKDFDPISQVVSTDFALLTGPDAVPAKNVGDFISWSKAQPHDIFMGTFGAGTPGHFGAYIFGDAVGLKPEMVHYRNTSDVITGLVAGDVQGVFGSVGAVASTVNGGKLKALAVTGQQRNPALPDTPTVAEQGYPELAFEAWFGLVAPAGTPPAILDYLSRHLREVLADPDTRKRIEAAGFTPTGTSREDFIRIIESDRELWGKAVAATGFKAE